MGLRALSTGMQQISFQNSCSDHSTYRPAKSRTERSKRLKVQGARSSLGSAEQIHKESVCLSLQVLLGRKNPLLRDQVRAEVFLSAHGSLDMEKSNIEIPLFEPKSFERLRVRMRSSEARARHNKSNCLRNPDSAAESTPVSWALRIEAENKLMGHVKLQLDVAHLALATTTKAIGCRTSRSLEGETHWYPLASTIAKLQSGSLAAKGRKNGSGTTF